MNTFGQIAKTDRFKFFGNVDVGRDISLITLKENYTAVVLVCAILYDLFQFCKKIIIVFYFLIVIVWLRNLCF